MINKIKLIRSNLEYKSKPELIDMIIYGEAIFQTQKELIDGLLKELREWKKENDH